MMAGMIPPAPTLQPPPLAETDVSGPEQQTQINNYNVTNQNQRGVSTATPQNQLSMGARPDWLGHLAEGLLGSTYTGMSRPKYFGAGVGKM
jgi:hypothetical protein